MFHLYISQHLLLPLCFKHSSKLCWYAQNIFIVPLYLYELDSFDRSSCLDSLLYKLVLGVLMKEILLVRFDISVRSVNNRYHIPDFAVRGVFMKAVLLVLSGISDCPGNIAGTTFLTFLIESFLSVCLFSLKHHGFH